MSLLAVVAEAAQAPLPPPASRQWSGTPWDWIEIFAWGIALLIVVAFAVAICLAFRKGMISFTGIIAEKDGKASLSRFQALLFTFVFVISLGLIVMRTGQFPTELPIPVLALLGGSLGTYLVSKGIQRGMGGNGGDQPTTAANGNQAVADGNQTTGGPTIRLGRNAAAVLLAGFRLPTTVTLPTAGESRFLIPAGKNVFGPAVTVATVIGDVTLTISAIGVPAGVNFGGQVQYLAPGANAPQTVPFLNSTTIQTDQNAVSDVQVQWRAAADGVIVTTIVS